MIHRQFNDTSVVPPESILLYRCQWNVPAQISRSFSSTTSSAPDTPTEQSEHSNNRTLIPRRQIAAEFAILLPAGCGVVAAGAIGAEPARPGSPVTACDFAFIRSNGSLETPLMFRPEQMHAKGVSNLGASFGAYSGRVLSGTSRECVPEGRALSCSLKFLPCMDAFEVGASRLQSLKGPEKSFTATSGDAPTHMGLISLGFAVSEKLSGP